MGYNEKMLDLGSRRSIIREIFEYSKTRAAQIGAEQVFDFSLGNPSVPAPAAVNEAIKELIDNENSVSLHGYTSAQGDAEVRRVISESIRRRFGVNVTPELIYMSCGAAASLSICLKALMCEGDECVVLAPFFTEYRVFVENAGARLVVSRPQEKTFMVDIADLEEKITPCTKAVIVNSPNNPSGVVYPEGVIISLCSLLKRKSEEYGHKIYLIADEPYRELVYGDIKVPYLMNYYPDTLVCYSYSKSLSLPGERIGYIAVCPDCEDAEKIYLCICGAGRSLGYVCAPSLLQKVIVRCESAEVNIDAYRTNRDMLYEGLCSLGFECVHPDGAFYLLVKAPSGNAFEFYEAAKGQEILLVPCDDFGIEGYVRIAYCVSRDTIVGAMSGFEKLADEYDLRIKK